MEYQQDMLKGEVLPVMIRDDGVSLPRGVNWDTVMSLHGFYFSQNITKEPFAEDPLTRLVWVYARSKTKRISKGKTVKALRKMLRSSYPTAFHELVTCGYKNPKKVLHDFDHRALHALDPLLTDQPDIVFIDNYANAEQQYLFEANGIRKKGYSTFITTTPNAIKTQLEAKGSITLTDLIY